jgi:hypothetical protein
VPAQNGSYKIPLTAGDGSGVIVSTANPEGVDVYITRAILEIETPSTGASTLDIGVDASASVSDDLLFDGYSGATAVITDNIKAKTGNAVEGLKWGSDEFLNVAEASGDVTGLVGNLYVEYIRML